LKWITRKTEVNRCLASLDIEYRENKLEMTETLGFGYDLMSRGIEMLRDDDSPARAYLFLPSNNPDSLKLVHFAK
jgi:hypothetical protein